MRIIIFLCLLMLLPPMSAQVFKGGFVAGLAFSQVEGDDFSGYKKPGIQAGFVSDAYFSPKFSGGFEILFSQRGANTDFNPDKYLDGFSMRFNYIEIPAVIKYHDKNKMVFGLGLVYSRLLNSKLITQGIEDDQYFIINPPHKSDYGFTAIISYPLYKILSVDIKYNYSLLPFRKDNVSNFRNLGQYHNFIALRFSVLFNALGKQNALLSE